ncbi:hypothetical protein J6590_105538 [Homalodisca vitripennis]|nr:hypothetical protein J6590_105538 [Homalodisca vitripennis]
MQCYPSRPISTHNIRSEATGKWQLSSDNYRIERHRTVDHEHLPSQPGVQYVDRLSDSMENALLLERIKT